MVIRIRRILYRLLFIHFVLAPLSILFYPSFVSCLTRSPLSGKTLITGVVCDSLSGKLLEGVNIMVSGTQTGSTTDESGFFRIYLSPGSYELIFRFIGYRKRRQQLAVGNSLLHLDIKLVPEVLKLGGVEITAERFQEHAASYQIKPKELKVIPGFYGDVYRSVKTLPGVSSNNELSSSYHVHGGSADENLIILNGIELHQPRRLRYSYQEGMSAINPAMLKSLQLTSGGFPARYGEKLSSVLEVEYRSRCPRLLRGEAEISLINAGLFLEGRIGKGGYWALAARGADTGLIVNTLATKGTYNPAYYDVQTHVSLPLTSRHTLSVLAIWAKNDFHLIPQIRYSYYMTGFMSFSAFISYFKGEENNTYQSTVGALSLESRLTKNWTWRNTFTLYKDNEEEWVNTRADIYHTPDVPPDLDIDIEEFTKSRWTTYNNDLNYWSFGYQSDATGLIHSNHLVQIGVRLQRQYFSDHIFESIIERGSPSEEDEFIGEEDFRFESSAKLTSHLISAYGEDTWYLLPNVSLNSGVRVNFFSFNREWLISPRFRLKWELNPRTWFALAWGHYAQPPAYKELRSTEHGLNPSLKGQQAYHYILSYHHRKESGSEMRLEAFYNRLTRLIPYRYDDIFIRYESESGGHGYVYGLSYYWYGRINPRLTSWISYSYMMAREDIDGDKVGFVPRPTDQRHTFSAVLQDDMPQLPNSQAHIRFLFGSGYPRTPKYVREDPETGERTIAEGQRNCERQDFYRRFDVGFSYNYTFRQRYHIRTTFEILNFFSMVNLLSYSYYTDSGGMLIAVRNNLTPRIFNVRVNVRF